MILDQVVQNQNIPSLSEYENLKKTVETLMKRVSTLESKIEIFEEDRKLNL